MVQGLLETRGYIDCAEDANVITIILSVLGTYYAAGDGTYPQNRAPIDMTVQLKASHKFILSMSLGRWVFSYVSLCPMSFENPLKLILSFFLHIPQRNLRRINTS